MRIGVLGTGMVGETIGAKLVELGHDVKMGSRSAGNEKALAWAKRAGARASTGTFAEAAASAELVFNCTGGAVSLEALNLATAANLSGKVLIDLANPLDFSKGMPPTLTVCNTDSLGEQIQRAFPQAKVVKALNTMNCGLMVNPRALPESHTVFLAGNDEGAKKSVATLLKSFGWRDEEIFDAGDISVARGLEAWLLLWVRIYGKAQTPNFNARLVWGKKT